MSAKVHFQPNAGFPMKVGIAIPTLADGDAVGNDALGMVRHLRGRGLDVEIFAERSRVAEPTRPLRELARAVGSDDVLVYHHSIGCEAGVRAIERAPCRRKAVKYHNVTPAKFFQNLDADAARACEQGIAQVGRLAESDAVLWADSSYNGAHFGEFVPGRAFAELPPFHHADRLLTLEPDYRAASGLDDWTTNILLIGRIVPNKNIPLALAAFADYRRLFNPHSRLVIVGDQPIPLHSAEVHNAIRERGLEGHVLITGKVSVPQLKALYLTADALLVTSLHEGFCVPLIEAMGLRVPIIAVPNAAIGFTGGDAAFYAEGNASALAERLDGVLTDPDLRERHLHAGWERYRDHFSNDAVEAKFAELFDELLAG